VSSEGLGLFEGAAVLETRCEFCGLAVVKSPDHMDQGIGSPSSSNRPCNLVCCVSARETEEGAEMTIERVEKALCASPLTEQVGTAWCRGDIHGA